MPKATKTPFWSSPPSPYYSITTLSELGREGRNRTGFGASVAPARSILTTAITGPSRDRQRNRLQNGRFTAFRQVAVYSLTTYQRVRTNSFKPALLAFLLAQFDPENPRIVASSVGACHSAGHPAMDLPSCSSRPRPRLWLLRRNLAPAGEESFPVCACCHSVAEAPLPGGTGAGGCVSSGAALLSGAW